MSTEPAIDPVVDFTALRQQPFDLLLAMERSLRVSRQDVTAGETTTWTGLAFRVHDRWLVVPREDVREISVLPRLTRVPGAKAWLRGVANVRGSLLPVTDLAQLLGLPRSADTRNRRVLVLNSDSVPAGFLVDEVAGYRQFGVGDQRNEHARGTGGIEPYLLGAFHRDGRDWLALSFHKLVRGEAFARAGA